MELSDCDWACGFGCACDDDSFCVGDSAYSSAEVADS